MSLTKGLSILQEVAPAGSVTDAWRNTPLSEVAYDSRKVVPGALFVCIRGFKTDGHLYIQEAIARGAAAVVVEQAQAIPPHAPVPFVVVPDARRALATLSSNAYQAPSRRLCLIGVTGTNGKTSVTYMIRHVFLAAGRPTGVIGTLGARIGEQPVPLDRTTPEAPDLERVLAQMVSAGITTCAMEVSSHAIALHRVRELAFDFGVFTNLTQDHLDFHITTESYRATKLQLFSELARSSGKPFTGVINIDDPSAPLFLQATHGKTATYGLGESAQVRATDPVVTPQGVRYQCTTPEGTAAVALKTGGFFSVHNSLAAIATCLAAGLALDVIVEALAHFPGVPGRFEAVPSNKPFTVIIDYAHTPDAIQNVLQSARALRPTRLTLVVGCGGDRDRTKRKPIGQLAATLADRVIITSDNPRSEDPEAIITDILQGVPKDAPATVSAVTDRREAIEAAIADAVPGELIIIAGKGHEDYQIFADRTIHFSDREVAEAALRRR